MARIEPKVVVVAIANAKALRQLSRAREAVERVAESSPWSEDAKQAIRLIRKAAKGLSIQPAK